MTHTLESDTSSSSPERPEVPKDLPVVRRFAGLFSDRFRGAYSSDDSIEAKRAAIEEYLPRDLAAGELGRAQSVLEDGWNDDNRSRSLDSERRDALVELHTTAAGEMTPERSQAAAVTTEVVMREASLRSPDRGLVRAYNSLFVRGASSVEEQMEAITFIEGLITEASVLDPEGTQIEDLRTMRDRCHQKVKSELEMTANQTELTGRIQAIVGENADFPMDGIERATAYLSGAAADRMRQVVAEIERMTDPLERSALLLELASGKIAVHDDEKYAQWEQERSTKLAAQESRRQARDVASARARVEAAAQSKANLRPPGV